ncbi:MAG: leucyl aminopeptidase [Anaerolineales bacterium]
MLTLKLDSAATGPIFTPALAPETPAADAPGKENGDIRTVNGKLVLSLGTQKKLSPESIRRAGGIFAKWLEKNGVAEATLELPALFGLGMPPSSAFNALAEGLLLGAFSFQAYKSAGQEFAVSLTLRFEADGALSGEALQALLQQAVIACEAVNLARAWAHEPANIINPVTLAARVETLAAESGLKCTILDDKQLAEMGAGAIVAVGKGSATPSRLIVLEYAGKSAEKPLALVGKAITFDTGGYSLKPVDGIVGMKYDKCGGMAVIATLLAAARLGLKTPLVGIVAAAENMVSEVAYRPNDILKTLSGKTVEIISTDAEGRLVLCDALTYAQQKFAPRAVIDLATLTGGVVIALGSTRAGLMSNDDALAEALFASGERTHERLWRLPLDDDYFELIKGDDADMKNSSGIRKAHPVTGGIFLKQFVADEMPWAHLDIAGTADTERDAPYCQKGATGFGVRLLLDYLRGLE